MQKTDFIAEVARHTGMPQQAIRQALNGAIGTFEVRHRSQRAGVHPTTRQPITISATSTPGFTAGHTLREAVRAGTAVEPR